MTHCELVDLLFYNIFSTFTFVLLSIFSYIDMVTWSLVSLTVSGNANSRQQKCQQNSDDDDDGTESMFAANCWKY